MELLKANNVRILFNQLFSCREASIRLQHHVELLSHYRTCRTIPKGFRLKFHGGTTDSTLQSKINSTLVKCSKKLMGLFESHYKRQLPHLDREEKKFLQVLDRQHPEHVASITTKLSERTKKVTEKYKTSRIRKYDRDGIRPNLDHSPAVSSSVEECKRFEPINLTDQNIDQSLVHLCSHGPSFVPTPTAVDWNDLQQKWQDFKRKVRWRTLFYSPGELPNTFVQGPLDAPYQKSKKDPPLASVPAVEVFLSRVERDLFSKTTLKKMPDNLSSHERSALKKFRNTSIEERNLVIRLQDKGSNFVFLDNDSDSNKVKEQMERGSFDQLDFDPSSETCSDIEKWVEKWKPLGLSLKWITFITANDAPHPGTNYPLVKTHKENNPARVITSGCNTATENLSFFVEKYCKIAMNAIPCRVRDTSHMLDIVDDLNEAGVSDGDILVSFDITNMFPSIDNQSGMERVRRKLNAYEDQFDVPVECICEALEICLTKNCSSYRGEYWLQKNGTAMGPKNACSYADIVAEEIDNRVLNSRDIYPELCCWFRFRDDTFVLWRGSEERLQEFFQVLNTFDPNLQFTIDVGKRSLHFLDLHITIVNNRLETSVYSKPTDAHLYLNAKSSHPKSQIKGIAKGVALRIRRICSSDADFKEKSARYAEYLIDCGHDRIHVGKVFEEVEKMSRTEARKSKKKQTGHPCIFVTTFNPLAPDIGKILRKHRSIIEDDERAKLILPESSIRVAYKRSANLKELLAPSNPYKNTQRELKGCFKCTAKRCDCCKEFLNACTSIRSAVTGRTFTIRKSLSCKSTNVVYLAECAVCGLQGVGSTINFRTRLANYKSHIKYNKRTCSIATHFIDVHSACHKNLKFTLIDQEHNNLRFCENFWIGTLLTNLKGLNSTHDFVQQ